jgi:hypothetical protein
MEFHGNTFDIFGMATFLLFYVERPKNSEHFTISGADKSRP